LVREKQAAGAAGKADELTDSLGSKSQARVDEEMVGLPENFESWVSRKDLEDHIKNSDIGLAEDWDASQVHDYVTNIKKGERPDPDSYLDQGYMNIHLSEFEGGASRFMTKKNIDKYGIGQKDGTSFVMTRKQADQIISSANGDAKVMEKALGLPEGFLDGNELIRVDIPNPGKLNLRIPSGNEAGASKQWIPGGRLPDGNLEAVIDAGDISPKEYEIVPLDF
jgi:filamentous hemagglutinin